MPLKRALLASAATPILALALTTGSSYAGSATVRPDTLTSGSFLIAQADQPSDDELRKRRQRQGGEQRQPQGGERAQPQERRQGGQGEAPQQAEQPRPKRQREQAQPERQREQAEPRRQREEARPERRQEREAQPEQRQAEQPQRRKKEQSERKAEPSERRKNAEPEQKPTAAERQKRKTEPSGRMTAEPKSEEKATPRRKENAGNAERQRGTGENAVKPKPKSEETAKPQPRQTEKPKTEEAKPSERQAPQPTERKATAPSGEEKPTGNAERKMKPAERQGETAEKPKRREGEKTRQAQPENRKRQPATTGEPAQAQGEKAPKLAPVKSLNDNQPARKATEPAAADAKPQLLDVPNGAPVLDSAKGREDRGARERNRDRQQRREERARQRQENQRPPQQPVEIRSVTAVQGERIQEAPTYRPPQNVTIEKEVHNRYIVNVDNRTYVENNDYDRISRRAEDVYYERLPDDNTRQVVVRPNGVRVVTIRNRYGDILQRSRIRNGEETVLIYAPDYDRDHRDMFFQPVDLPPIQLTEPVDEYILDAGSASPDQYVTFLEKPPIEPIEQVYTLDQVRYSARLRDIMPRIDLDTITFQTGSADIEQSQAQSLEALANAINDVLQDDPGQIFLVEGHTDAVGSDQANLILSDQRAESVAAALTQDFDVPPENLVTQGYGEQYLKVETDGPSRVNRRVAIRRITPLVRPTAQR